MKDIANLFMIIVLMSCHHGNVVLASHSDIEFISTAIAARLNVPDTCDLYGNNLTGTVYDTQMPSIQIPSSSWINAYYDQSPQLAFVGCLRSTFSNSYIDLDEFENGNQINKCIKQCSGTPNSIYLTNNRCHCGYDNWAWGPYRQYYKQCDVFNMKHLRCGKEDYSVCKYRIRTSPSASTVQVGLHMWGRSTTALCTAVRSSESGYELGGFNCSTSLPFVCERIRNGDPNTTSNTDTLTTHTLITQVGVTMNSTYNEPNSSHSPDSSTQSSIQYDTSTNNMNPDLSSDSSLVSRETKTTEQYFTTKSFDSTSGNTSVPFTVGPPFKSNASDKEQTINVSIIIIGSLFAVLFLVMILVLVIGIIYRRKRTKHKPDNVDQLELYADKQDSVQRVSNELNYDNTLYEQQDNEYAVASEVRDKNGISCTMISAPTNNVEEAYDYGFTTPIHSDNTVSSDFPKYRDVPFVDTENASDDVYQNVHRSIEVRPIKPHNVPGSEVNIESKYDQLQNSNFPLNIAHSGPGRETDMCDTNLVANSFYDHLETTDNGEGNRNESTYVTDMFSTKNHGDYDIFERQRSMSDDKFTNNYDHVKIEHQNENSTMYDTFINNDIEDTELSNYDVM